MNNWVRFSMKNAGVIFIAMLMILAGGIYSAISMKMEEMPNVDIPYLSVVAVYPGATPEQALEDVGKPMEQALSGLKNLKNLYVTSGSDYVAATLEFDLKQPMGEAEKDINSALAGLKLPDGVQKPQVSKEGPNAEAVFSFAVNGNTDQATIQQYINEQIKPLFSTIQGISSVNVQGQSEKKLYIKADPDKLQEHNLSLDRIKQALLANNISVPAGQVTVDDKSLNVEIKKKIQSVEDVKKIDLVIVDQDMSALTDAFKSVGDGFGTVGSSMGKLGQSVGSLTKGQMLLQGQIQVMQGIYAYAAEKMSYEAELANLVNQDALARSENKTLAPEQIKRMETLQKQLIPAVAAKIMSLQNQLTLLEAQVNASGSDAASTLQSLASGSNSGKKTGTVSAKPALSIKSLALGEVAEVNYASGKDQVLTRLNGSPAVVTDIKTQPGSNTVEVVKQIQQKLEKLSLPAGYQLTYLRDGSQQIKKSVNNMLREAMLGAFFAMLVTFLFLRNWRSTLVAILSIPLSIFASMMFLRWLNYSLNIMTLAGIAVAVGRVVDDSIVVIENIYRRVRTSQTRNADLVLEATKEVGQAVTSSTITTVAVFGPLSFVPGIVGKFFAPFGITVVVSLIFSLLVAITVVPLLARLFLLGIKHQEAKENLLQRTYRKVLGWSLNHKLAVAGLALLLLGSSAYLVQKIPQNFLPSEKTVSYALRVTLPVGTATEKTDSIAARIESRLQQRGDIKSYQTNVRGENLRIQIELKDDVTREDTKEFETDMQGVFSTLGADAKVALSPLGMVSNGGLFMVVNGPNVTTLKQAGSQIMEAIKDVPGLANPETNLSAVKPQISIDVNPDAAASKGLNPAMVALAVRQMINGDSVTKVVLDGRTTEVNLGLKVDNLNSLEVIGKQTVTNMAGAQVSLSEVAAVKEVPGPTSIQRLNQQEYISVSGRFTTDNSSGVLKEVQSRVDKLKLPDGVTYYFEGESKAMGDGFRNMALAMGAAIVLVYMVMLVAFGEMLAPFAILFSLPFIFVGGIAGLYFSGESLGIPSMVGFLMLIGIVVTNAIVFTDRVLHNRTAGMDTKSALVEAGVTRIRPILMTAVATIGALLPLAISQEGGIISRSLAIVVISGLTTSTILTLVIVPVAYQVLDSVRQRIFAGVRQTEGCADTAK
ncbi:MAG TPA: efflux RND transporter permease subunit [Verrucomicrobiae bacterium]|nr:efflux RND transporter permease subunit [Verrucomicrobiae bacterium]